MEPADRIHPDFDWTGIQFDPGPKRVSRLIETVEVLKGLFGEGPFSHAGEFFTITEYDAMPKPVQKPHPPFLIGAGGKRMIHLAAKEADIIGLLPSMGSGGADFAVDEMTVPGLRAKVDLVREIAPERFDQIEFNSLTQVLEITDDPAAVLARLKEDWMPEEPEWKPSPFVLVGSVESIADDIRGYAETLGFTYFTLRDNMLEAFAPVIARLK